MREDRVGLGVDGELHGRDRREMEQEGLSDAVLAVHQPPIGGQDDGIAQVGLHDAPSVLGDRTVGRWGRLPEPAVLVELGNTIEVRLNRK